MVGGPLIGRGPPVHTPYHSTLNGGKASDWLRPIPCRQEGNKLPKGQYQSGNGYSTGVHLPGHLACDPSSQREASHVSSQGKEAVFVTHDIHNERLEILEFLYLVEKFLANIFQKFFHYNTKSESSGSKSSEEEYTEDSTQYFYFKAK